MMDIQGLAYIVAESTNLSAWATYAQGVLGMSCSEAPGGGLYIKMDERQYRFLVVPGQRDGYVASGWEVLDQGAFEAALQTLAAAG